MKTASIVCIVVLLACCAPALQASIGPDAAGYTATDQITFGFEGIAATGIKILGGMDDSTALVNLGFSFQFYGQAYTSLCISTNGLVAFGSCNADFANVDLTGAAPGGDSRIVAPFWTDLNFSTPGADAVYYQALGEAPNRRFVVQWNSAFPLNGSSGATFQAIFQETSNKITFQYLSVGACGNGSAATVGIRDAGGHLNNRRLQWSYNAPVITNGLALLFSPKAGPAPISYLISATSNPAAGGTVTGAGSLPSGSTATLTAVPNAGYRFSQWSGSRGISTTNPMTFTVTGAAQVVANFAKLVPVIAASITGKTGTANARVWTVQLKNTGTAAAADAVLNKVTLTQTYGAACTPVVVTSMPVTYGALAPGGGSASNPVTINFTGSGCTTARFTAKFEFQANSGTYSGTSSVTNQYQ